MIEIEKYPRNDENEARTRERHWYEVLNANLNMISPTLDLEKKRINGKIYKKNYYEQNKDKCTKMNKEYHEIHKEFFIEYQKLYHEKHKEFFIEYQKEYQKQYREKNKDNIKQKNNEKHQCLCGGCYTTVNKSYHYKTKKHLKYIQENESN